MSRTVHALLVAIDDYPPPVRKLRGCANDINAMHAFLKERTATDTLSVKTLVNAEATRENVIAAFRAHFAGAKQGDVALFCYSGHGSQEQAPAEFWHIEPDRLNETLVCHDSRLPDRWDLADKELAVLINEVAGKGAHVVVILDSCHSGSGTRLADNAQTTHRRIETDLRQRPLSTYIADVQALTASSVGRDLSARPAGWNVAGRHVLLAACRDDEEALEYSGDGKIHGAFSYFLGQTLQTAGPEATYRDLFGRADALVRTQVKRQSPQMEATDPDDLRQPFLGGAIRPRPRYFIASAADGVWSINAGRLHGLPQPQGEDAVGLALFTWAATEDDLKDPARAVHKARVTAVNPATSLIEVEGGADPAAGPLKAVITSFPAPRMKVRFEGDTEGVAQLAAALARAGDGGVPSFYVRAAADGETADYRVTASGGRYLIAKPDDDRPLAEAIDGYTELAADATVARLEHIERWKAAAEMNNLATSIREGDVEVEVQVNGKPVTTPDVRLEYAREGNGWKEPKIKVRLKNASTRTLYVALLDLTELFGIYTILNHVGSQKLDPGQETFANNGQEIGCSIPNELWQQGMCEIKDVLKVVVSTADFDARRMIQDDLPAFRTRGDLDRARGDVTRGVADAPGTLQRLMDRVKTRRIGGSDAQQIDDWRCLQRNFTIVRPLAAQPLDASRPVTLTGGVTVQPHAALRVTEVRLDGAELARRAISAAPPLPRLLYDDPSVTQPFELTASRAVGGVLNVLELRGVNDPALVTPSAPLEIDVPQPLGPGEDVLALGTDGEFHLPLGYGRRDGDRTRVVLERLPQPDEAGTRSLGGALRIFFQKVISRVFGTTYPYPILAAADVGADGAVRSEQDPDRVKARVASARRIALFVHGIIGETANMAPALRLAGVADRYDLVLTFDYENLNDPIADTARRLKQRLEQAGLVAGSGKQLDVIAHSMGGLVSRWFIEREGGNKVVRRLVMLGTPNHGSPWPGVADWATTALAIGLNGLSKVAWPAAVAGWLVRASSHARVTLGQLDPTSQFLRDLHGSADPKVPYVMIAGDTSRIPAPANDPRQSALKRLLARLWSDRTKYDLANLFFDTAENDIAVTVQSMRHVADGRAPAFDVRVTPCDHLSYFQNADSLRELAAVLSVT